MGLLDSTSEEPQSKLRRYIVSGLVLTLLGAAGLWRVFRFHTEKKTTESFFAALSGGNTEEAYRIWKAQTSYTYQDFLGDWGPTGYYGPVRSFEIQTAQQLQGASGVVVVVSLSAQSPFPAPTDAEGRRKLKEARLWVERSDQSLSYPP